MRRYQLVVRVHPVRGFVFSRRRPDISASRREYFDRLTHYSDRQLLFALRLSASERLGSGASEGSESSRKAIDQAMARHHQYRGGLEPAFMYARPELGA